VTEEQKQRNILDDIADGIRQVFDDIDNLLNPEKHKRERVRVPIPVRTPDRRDPRKRR